MTLAPIAMRTSLCFKLAALIVVLVISARCFAQAESGDNAESARRFVLSLYARYGPDGNPANLSADNATEVFDRSLIALVKIDAAAVGPGHFGVLDYDPLCNCQQTDVDFPGLRITTELVNASHANATVTFNDVNQHPIKIVLTLMRSESGWRIFNVEDFTGPGPHTDLRTLLSSEIQKKIRQAFFASAPEIIRCSTLATKPTSPSAPQLPAASCLPEIPGSRRRRSKYA